MVMMPRESKGDGITVPGGVGSMIIFFHEKTPQSESFNVGYVKPPTLEI